MVYSSTETASHTGAGSSACTLAASAGQPGCSDVGKSPAACTMITIHMHMSRSTKAPHVRQHCPHTCSERRPAGVLYHQLLPCGACGRQLQRARVSVRACGKARHILLADSDSLGIMCLVDSRQLSPFPASPPASNRQDL